MYLNFSIQSILCKNKRYARCSKQEIHQAKTISEDNEKQYTQYTAHAVTNVYGRKGLSLLKPFYLYTSLR